MTKLVAIITVTVWAAVGAAFNAKANTNIAMHWGQETRQETLQNMTDPAVDIFILEHFNAHDGLLDLAHPSSWAVLGGYMQEEQAKGHRILMSIKNASFDNETAGIHAADQIWDQFGNGTSDIRPIDPANIDGVVLDTTEAEGSPGYGGFINQLYKHFRENGTIGATVPSELSPSGTCYPVDFLFVQYPNASELTNTTNFLKWDNFTKSCPGDAKIMLDVPNTLDVSKSGLVKRAEGTWPNDNYTALALELQQLCSFGGIAIRNATRSAMRQAELYKSALVNGSMMDTNMACRYYKNGNGTIGGNNGTVGGNNGTVGGNNGTIGGAGTGWNSTTGGGGGTGWNGTTGGGGGGSSGGWNGTSGPAGAGRYNNTGGTLGSGAWNRTGISNSTTNGGGYIIGGNSSNGVFTKVVQIHTGSGKNQGIATSTFLAQLETGTPLFNDTGVGGSGSDAAGAGAMGNSAGFGDNTDTGVGGSGSDAAGAGAMGNSAGFGDNTDTGVGGSGSDAAGAGAMGNSAGFGDNTDTGVGGSGSDAAGAGAMGNSAGFGDNTDTGVGGSGSDAARAGAMGNSAGFWDDYDTGVGGSGSDAAAAGAMGRG